MARPPRSAMAARSYARAASSSVSYVPSVILRCSLSCARRGRRSGRAAQETLRARGAGGAQGARRAVGGATRSPRAHRLCAACRAASRSAPQPEPVHPQGGYVTDEARPLGSSVPPAAARGALDRASWARLDLGDPSARALPAPQRDALERRLGRRVRRAGPIRRNGHARRVPGGGVAGCACGRRRPLALARARRRARARCRRARALPRTQSMSQACAERMHADVKHICIRARQRPHPKNP